MTKHGLEDWWPCGVPGTLVTVLWTAAFKMAVCVVVLISYIVMILLSYYSGRQDERRRS